MVKYVQHVCIVFVFLWSHAFFLKWYRCSFGEVQVAYLGYVVTSAAFVADNSIIHAIKDWPKPHSL